MNKIFAKILGFLFILALALTFINCSSSELQPESWQPNEPGRGEILPDDPQLDLLTGLGLYPSVKPPTDPLGNPLPDNYQPLKNLATKKVSEIFTMGVAFNASSGLAANGSRYNYYLSDVNFNTSNLSITSTSVSRESFDWKADLPNKSLAVDLNNDGIEEVVLLVAPNGAGNECTIYVGTFPVNGKSVGVPTWTYGGYIPYVPGDNK
ncbi:MAG: hypothetical protein FWH53_11940, partial [Leptospirales bacterium]|nr:hypothetical protein [Leptospirales bacterium]